MREIYINPTVHGIQRAGNTRANVDALARYTPSASSMGTMRASGTAQMRGSLANLRNLARSSALSAWIGSGRPALVKPAAVQAPSRCSPSTALFKVGDLLLTTDG